MGSFRVIIGILHYMGLYSQLNAASKPAVPAEVDNHISGNGRFTVVVIMYPIHYSRLVIGQG